MKKLLTFEMNEFFNFVKTGMKGVDIEKINTNVRHQIIDGENIYTDCLDLRIKPIVGEKRQAIMNIVDYFTIEEENDDNEYIVVAVELTDLPEVINKVTGEKVYESYELFEANLNGKFEEHIGFYVK